MPQATTRTTRRSGIAQKAPARRTTAKKSTPTRTTRTTRQLGVQRIKAATLVRDPDVHPRDPHYQPANLRHVMDALAMGIPLPSVVANRKTLQVVDGWHQIEAALRADSDAVIEVDLQDYADNGAMFLEAAHINAVHGLPLNSYDRARVIMLAEDYGLTLEAVSAALATPIATLAKMKQTRQAFRGDGTTIMLKRSLRHLHGKTITEKQEQLNRRMSGWSPAFHADQLLLMLQNGNVDWNDHLRTSLIELRDLLNTISIP